MKRLRRRFILSAMLSLFAVLAAIVAGMNILGYFNVIDSTDNSIRIITDNKGTFPHPLDRERMQPNPDPQPTPGNEGRASDSNQTPPPKPAGEEGQPDMRRDFSAEAPYETRYFTVYFKDGEIVGTHMDNIAALTEDEAREMAATVLGQADESGFIEGTYRYRVSRESGQTSVETEDGESADVLYDTMVVFVNCEKRLDAFFSSLWISVLVSLAGVIVVFILIVVTSKMVFRPVEESERRQKQFLTDASHELKTPLAIIKANTEVMELESGESKWTQSNRHQVERLSGLVDQMLALTRLDESESGRPDAGKGETGPKDFSLSEVLREIVESYQAPAEVAGKEIHTEIAEAVKIRTNEKNIRQLIGLLMDNAVKYATPDTTIDVRLTAKGHRATLTVHNLAEDIPVGDNEALFERFYRLDSSRNSETGGSGIGLSVARSIVERSGGKISARSEDGRSLTITVTLPL